VTGHTRTGRVRIIGGRWRGRRIGFPDVEGLRPSPDRTRETLFNWLAPYLAGARVLDLYAGSGVLGLEALSRGAVSVTAVDAHQQVVRQLRETARELNAVDFTVVPADAMSFLHQAGSRAFDLVFADPPHAGADYNALVEVLDASGVVASNGWVYLEFPTPHGTRVSFPERWEQYRSSRAGQLTYQLWRRKGHDAD
jgi:16S rRNA (guanine966-N2)-methyltransferase